MALGDSGGRSEAAVHLPTEVSVGEGAGREDAGDITFGSEYLREPPGRSVPAGECGSSPEVCVLPQKHRPAWGDRQGWRSFPLILPSAA